MDNDKLRQYIRQVINEVKDEDDDLEEMTGTGAVAGFDTPNAFSNGSESDKKRKKKTATQLGYTIVTEADDSGMGMIYDRHGYVYAVKTDKGKLATNVTVDGKVYSYQKPARKYINYDKGVNFLGKEDIQKAKTILRENRWLDLKREDATPKAKLGVGIRRIKNQLSEIETFLNWYGRLKTENGVNSDDYWKQTTRNLHKIRERLMNISDKIRKL